MADSIHEKIEALPELSRRRCIYRVPKPLRDVNAQAYTPIVISIGPFHYQELPDTEVDKLKYVESFLLYCQFNASLHTLLQIVKDKEIEIRESYANPTMHISSEKFTQMIFIDSLFIIELLRKYYGQSQITDDRIWGNPYIFEPILRDIQLIENQLPFFILKDLYRTAFKPHENVDVPYLTDLACYIFGLNKTKLTDIDVETNEANCCHLIDLQRSCCVPPVQQSVRGKSVSSTGLCPSATTLYESGIKFQAVESVNSNWNHIQYDSEKGVLIIPTYNVSIDTESLSRNMLAFEQCHYRSSGGVLHIVDFQRFFNSLIDTPEDVQVLVRAGVIKNWMGTDKEVSDMFNSQGDHIFLSISDYTYGTIAGQLTDYCDKRWNRYKAILKHKYFNHPWAAISVAYAIILLVLTLIQVATGIMAI